MGKIVSPSPDSFAGVFYQIFKKLIPFYTIYFRKQERRDTSQLISGASYQRKIAQQRKLQTNIPHKLRCKNPQENAGKSNPRMYKKNSKP